MSRISYSDEEDFPGQFGLWQANCDRQIASKRGQLALLELRDALLAMPSKRLIANTMAKDGDVCAVGSLLAHRRVQSGASFLEATEALRQSVVHAWRDDMGGEWEEDTAEAAMKEGVPRLVAWQLVALNDIHLDFDTPEERFEKVVAWVNERLKAKAPTHD